MKKIFTTIIMAGVLAVSAMAVTVNDVAGVFNGNLNIGGDNYPNKDVYILPGVQNNTITFVLPNFKFGAASLGDIVLVNIPMNSSGKLTLDNASLYIKAISERAEISVLNGIKDGNTTYNSIVSASSAQVLLSIAAPSLPEPIMVLFSGNKVTDKNYAVNNGGFEGNWSNSEPSGWHSFPSATGSLASMAGGDNQFKQSTDKRPGSTGSHSAMIASNLIVGVKANGNCTNGQINAGSTTADDAANNYNFSDPSNSGYNTPFVGQPDSLVFWAKYIPADKNPSNSVNKARAHAVITTNARYQDPESSNYSSVKIADAGINYSANSQMTWQRYSIPFTYTSVDPATAAYVLITFTTNMTPGGGSTYSEGGLFNKKYYYDNIYLDDVEMIYNHALKTFKMGNTNISFSNGRANTNSVFSDSDYNFTATTNGKAAKSFIGFDATNNQVHVYVVANNYSQAKAYSLYTLQMAEPIRDTYYEYAATTCANEPYSDNLFTNLTQSGEYHTTIPNAAGHDSIITLTLRVLPTYSKTSSATIQMGKSYNWRGHKYENLTPGIYTFADSLQTKAGCDSVFTLTLTVEAIDYSSSEEMTVCQNEEAEWHGKTLPTAEAGDVIVRDTLQSVYGTDSIVTLNLTVQPSYIIPEEVTIKMDSSLTWRDKEYKDLVPGVYIYADTLPTQAGCDSIFTLKLTVEAIGYLFQEEQTACQNEEAEWHGKTLPTAKAGTVVVYDSLKSVFGMDSVFCLTLTVLPIWLKEEVKYVNEADLEWHGQTIQGLPHSNEPYFYYDTLQAVNGCDSIWVLRLFVSDIPITYGEYEIVICNGEVEEFEGVKYSEPFEGDVRSTTPNVYGGDSIVHLTVRVLPSYTIDEYMTIIIGENRSWEWQNLSTLDEGQYELYASYYTDEDCDSTIVLHLTVDAEPVQSGIPNVPQDGERVHKIIWNGRLYIIRDDETIYDIIGTKVK